MTDKEKIRAEIERLHELHRGGAGDCYYRLALRTVLHYIDSLQEEPVSDDLGKVSSLNTIREIKTRIAQCNGFNRKHREEVFSLLDSLRPQNRWKPTEKQIMALRWVLNHIPYDIHKEEISGLLEQIKGL